jgi:glucans biosynthesis protein
MATAIALALLSAAIARAVAAPGPTAAANATPAPGFDFDDVAAKAKDLAKEPFKAPPQVPEWLAKINYDQWRDIRFRTDQTLWREPPGPFQVQLFHPASSTTAPSP